MAKKQRCFETECVLGPKQPFSFCCSHQLLLPRSIASAYLLLASFAGSYATKRERRALSAPVLSLSINALVSMDSLDA